MQLMSSSAAAAHAGCNPGTGLTCHCSLQETAHIVHAATDKSLIVVDELGKSTATAGGTSENCLESALPALCMLRQRGSGSHDCGF